MNPGLVVKLRPAGPWRIGPDSGARNRVDFIYHSDSLYSAITSAMARLGSLEEWLDATARKGPAAVCFSSCFPFLDEIGFVVPPRTIWPPTSPASMSARVRWKSARFVPLGIVQAILAGQQLDESHWSVDGASECLVPAGRLGPFRTGVRWSAAVDRLTGATERHSTACIEFRPGSGLWTVVSFQDEAVQEQWSGRVKAAFRLLADTGFGGERSRGWGRAEEPEFIEGTLPEMILPPPAPVVEAAGEKPPAELMVLEPEPLTAEETAPPELAALESPKPAEPEAPAIEPEALAIEPEMLAVEAATPVVEPEAADVQPEAAPTEPEAPVLELEPPAVEPEAAIVEPEPPTPEPVAETPAPDPEPTPNPQPPTPNPGFSAPEPAPEPVAATPAPGPRSLTPSFWLLSLFTPAEDDTVDWARGNYTVMSRGGRVESPSGSGELKKQVQMIAEGSVLYSAGAPQGAAADVAPDGFAHPVFRAGFALSIPLPGGEGSAS